MRNRHTITALACACALCVIFAARISAGDKTAPVPKPLVVAVDPTWPPMEFLDESRNPVGFDIDLINAIAEAEGFSVTIVPAEWDGIFDGLNTGKVDAICSTVTVTDDRKGRFGFTAPYLNAGQVAVTRKGFDTPLKDIPPKKKGAITATTGAACAAGKEKNEISTYYADEDLMKALVGEAIDAAYIDFPLAVRYCNQVEWSRGKIAMRPEILADEFVAIAFRKTDSETGKKLEAGLAKIRANGVYDRIVRKWLNAGGK